MEDNIKVQNKEKYFLIKIEFYIIGSIRSVEKLKIYYNLGKYKIFGIEKLRKI